MFLRGKINFDKIIAFHGMQLEDFEQTVQLDDKHVFLSYAPNDMIVPQKNFGDLKVIWKIQAVSLKYMKVHLVIN